MSDKDDEAFEYWLENNTTTQEEVEAYEAMSEKDRVKFCMKYTWRAACKFKQERIDILIKHDIANYREGVDLLIAENEKFREVLHFYANNSHWGGGSGDNWLSTFKIRDYTVKYDCGGGRAREALTEENRKERWLYYERLHRLEGLGDE